MESSRRDFIKKCGGLALSSAFLPLLGVANPAPSSVILSGHVWVYASKFPPDWDCYPVIETVFADFQKAGLEGIELMESTLRHEGYLPHLKELAEIHGMPVTGTSYYADMWNKDQTSEILEDAELVMLHLSKLGGSTFGITVGDAHRMKTEAELDTQGEVVSRLLKLGEKYAIQPNLHNHTFEVENDLHDLKGTLSRVPDLKLGPDINWLMRAGVDPVWFIQNYGDKMVYLHLRDQDVNGRWTRGLGEGVTDFPGIAQALKEAGFQGRAAIELAFEEPPMGAVTEHWVNSRRYVGQVFNW